MTTLVAAPWAFAVVFHFLVAHLSSGVKTTWANVVSNVNGAACMSAGMMFIRYAIEETPPSLEGFLLGLASASLAAMLLRIRVRDAYTPRSIESRR